MAWDRAKNIQDGQKHTLSQPKVENVLRDSELRWGGSFAFSHPGCVMNKVRQQVVKQG